MPARAANLRSGRSDALPNHVSTGAARGLATPHDLLLADVPGSAAIASRQRLVRGHCHCATQLSARKREPVPA
jgi:hypothetical protein